MPALPAPAILSCETISLGTDEQFPPQLGALRLDWNGWPGARQNRIWRMPLGMTISGPVPTRFGIRIIRVAENRYNVHLVWDRTGSAWMDLTRQEITATSFAKLLASIGTKLDSLLSQPVFDPTCEDALEK